MHFVDMLKAYEEGAVLSRTAPGFVERIATVRRLVGESPDVQARSIASPVYVSDLGVRRSEDPSRFFKANIDKLGLQAPDPVEDEELLVTVPLDRFADHLDAYLLLVGDFEVAARAVVRRIDELLASPSFAAPLYSGVVLASVGNQESIPLLEHAAENAKDLPSRFMALHRAAAAEMKRFGMPEKALGRLSRLREEIQVWQPRDEGDAMALLGVVDNLAALGEVLAGNLGQATLLETEAESMLSRGPVLGAIDDSERGRYRSQVEINLAQLELADGNIDDAITRMEANVDEARVSAPEYLSEALNAAGYGNYLAGFHQRAIGLLTEAEALVKHEASPTRLELIRKMLTAAYSKSGRPSEAAHYAALLESDPLGLESVKQ